jgi:hypothetical protein
VSAREALVALVERDGSITPASVLDEARDEASPLHTHFEWDDSEAAEQYRLVQARGLIRRYKVTVEVKPDTFVKVRQFSSVPAADPDEGTDYVLTSEALKDDAQRDFIFQQCMKEIASLRAKYGALVDFDAALRESIGAKRTRKKAS